MTPTDNLPNPGIFSDVPPEPEGTYYGITLQHQPTPTTCMPTCLAMALGEPVERVIAQLGGDHGWTNQQFTGILEACGFIWDQQVNARLMFHGWHFAVVPSLNNPGDSHQVLLYFDPETGELLVLDPSPPERNRYDLLAKNLVSWTELRPFYRGGSLP